LEASTRLIQPEIVERQFAAKMQNKVNLDGDAGAETIEDNRFTLE
jgi:hypothetical protein